MPKISKGYVDTAFGQVHYRTTGEDFVGPPIVMLHQTASSSEMFEALMLELGNEFMIFAPDTPGFGGSFRPSERGTIPLYARALLAALEGRQIETCLLFGHHTGATIAVEMLHQRKTLASKLALSGPCLLTNEGARELAQKTPAMELRADGGHLQQVWERILAKDPEAPLALREREATLTLSAGPRWTEGYHAVFNHAAEFDRDLRAVDVPTLVFAGDKDTVFELLEPSYRALRHGQKAIIPGQTTYSCDRAPKQVAQLLREFFR